MKFTENGEECTVLSQLPHQGRTLYVIELEDNDDYKKQECVFEVYDDIEDIPSRVEIAKDTAKIEELKKEIRQLIDQKKVALTAANSYSFSLNIGDNISFTRVKDNKMSICFEKVESIEVIKTVNGIEEIVGTGDFNLVSVKEILKSEEEKQLDCNKYNSSIADKIIADKIKTIGEYEDYIENKKKEIEELKSKKVL